MADYRRRKKAEALYDEPTEQLNNEQPVITNDDAMAKALKDQNYKDFYNRAIQVYNMESNAKKYLDNELANQGLGTQGYGSSARTGISNTAMNLYAQNESDYSNRNIQIEQDALNRQNQKQTEMDNQLIQFIQNDPTKADEFLKNYGYKDENGQWTDKWNNASEETKNYINSGLTSAQNNSVGYGAYDPNSNNIIYYDENGKAVSSPIQGNFEWESATLVNSANVGEISNGDVVEMKNGSGKQVYVIVQNGQYKYITKEQYQNYKGNKFLIETDKKPKKVK